jgi:hexosaminidase
LAAEPYQPAAGTPALTPALTHAQQQLLWGGEAALWTELVAPELLDTKLWPRLFVVAERFWSPAAAAANTPTDAAASLPQRLTQLDHYATQIGLQHRAQARASLQQWAKRELGALTPAQSQALHEFSQYLQPLHYYGRHHLKTAGGRYHLDEPLNQLADALLLEPPVLLALQQGFAKAPACKLPTGWPQWQQAFFQQQQLLSALATRSAELQRLLAQQRQFSQIISANHSPAEKASQLLQLLQPQGELVFAPAAAALDWADRCAAQMSK